ncbi:unnamed protein product [Effrenium voratum]|nr:unnamed protein product [Effrenium voratum]
MSFPSTPPAEEASLLTQPNRAPVGAAGDHFRSGRRPGAAVGEAGRADGSFGLAFGCLVSGLEELPTFGEEEQEQVEASEGGGATISNVRLQSLADANADLGRQLQRAKEESQAAQAQLQKAKEMEQDSKAAADAAERFKADLQPGLESFKDRILALEEQLQSGDQLQAGRGPGAGASSARRRCWSLCARRRTQEAASIEELGLRLQGLVQPLGAMRQDKAEAEAKLENLAAHAAALEEQVQGFRAREEATASAEAQLQEAKETEAVLTAELEQSKAAVSAAEEAKAELAAKVQESKDAAEAAERFKADLQPSLQSFKDRILALEAQLPGDSEQAEARDAADGQDEGEAGKSRRRSLSCCARRRPKEAASMEELGFRLQGVAERLNSLKQGKAEVEAEMQSSAAHAAALEEQVRGLQAREEAAASTEAQLQEAKEMEAALTAELEQSKAAVSAAEEAKAELEAKVQESKDSMEAAERFKADLQPSLQSFKDRILALEAQLPGDSEQAAARDAADGQDEGCWALRALNVDKLSRGQCCVEQGEAGKSRRRSLSCCARRRLFWAVRAGCVGLKLACIQATGKEAASMEELGFRLQGVVERLSALKGKPDVQVPELESFKDRIVELEAKLHDQPPEVGSGIEEARDEGDAATKSRRFSLSCCGHRRRSQEASVEELGKRLQALAQRVDVLKRGKSEAEAQLATSSAVAAALEQQLAKPGRMASTSGRSTSVSANLEELPTFGEDEEQEQVEALGQDGGATDISTVRLQSLADANADLGRQLQQAKEESQAAQAQLQKAKEMEQDSKNAAEAAERFKADLQPSLESFKDRILALEAQLQSGDQTQARAAGGQGAPASSARRCWSLCARRRTQEAASIEELGVRLEGLVRYLDALRQDKAEAEAKAENSEAHAAALEEQVRRFQAREEATASAEALLQEAKETEAALTAELEQSKAAASAAEAKVQESRADLEAAERFKADLRPGLESFKDRILALEAQLPDDQRTQVGSGVEEALDEGEAAAKSRRFSLSCCGHRRQSQEAASVAQLGNRLQALAQRLDTLKRGKSEAEARLATTSAEAAALDRQLAKLGERTASTSACVGDLPTFGDLPTLGENEEEQVDAREGATGSNVRLQSLAAANADLGRQLQQAKEESQAAQAQLQKAKGIEAALMAELEQSKAAVSAAEKAKMQSTSAAATALEQQLQQSQGECKAAKAELEQCNADLQQSQTSSGSLEQAKAALEAELEQSKAAVSAAEEAKAELTARFQESKDAVDAAERFKADLQPSLESFKDRILALEAQLPGDQPAQAEAGTAEDGQDEGSWALTALHDYFLDDCQKGGGGACFGGNKRSGQEAASVQELGFRLQGVAERLNALNRGKAEVEATATTLGQQLEQSQEECMVAKGQLQKAKDALEAREEAKASVEAQLQKAKETEAALTAELEQSKAAVSAAEEAKAELTAKVQESKDAVEAAERFKADLQPSLESFKDRILALEAQLPGDQPGASKPRGRSFSCCARRRSQEAASVEELGFRLQGVATRLKALKQGKAEVEAKMESTAVSATALEQQLQQSQEEFNAELGQCHAELQQLRTSSSSLEQAKAALEAELEQSKAAVSIAEEAKADLEAAERFKADLQPSLESFKDRILALEAQLPGDQPVQASLLGPCEVSTRAEGTEGEGEAAAKSRRFSLSCCGRRRPQEVAAVEELGNRLQALVQRLDALKRSKAEAEAQLATTSAVAAALEQQLVKPGEQAASAASAASASAASAQWTEVDMALPTFGEDEEQGATVPEISNVRLQSLAAASAALGRQLRQSQEEAQAAQAARGRAAGSGEAGGNEKQGHSAQAQLQRATAELEQSKAAVSAAEEAKADLAAAERFKADLQPGLESFKDRILALEAQLEIGDQPAEAEVRADEGQDEGGAAVKSRRRSLSCCARRRPQEAASVEELGFRLEAVAERLNVLKQGKAEAEAKMQSTAIAAAALEQQLQQWQEESKVAKGQLQQMKDALEAREEAKASVEAQLQRAKEAEAALTAELEQSKAAVSAAEETKAELTAKVQESKDAVEAAERFKADLQPSLESFKDRILALEAQLPGDQPAQALMRSSWLGLRREVLKMARMKAAWRRSRGQVTPPLLLLLRAAAEAASVEELGFRLEAVAERLNVLKQGKAEAEAKMQSTAIAAAALEQQLQQWQEESKVAKGQLQQMKDALEAREEAKASVEAQLQRAKEAEAALTAELEQSKAAVSAAEETKAAKMESTAAAASAALEQQLQQSQEECKAAKVQLEAARSGQGSASGSQEAENLLWLPTFGEEHDEDESKDNEAKVAQLTQAAAELRRQLGQAQQQLQDAQAELQRARAAEAGALEASRAAKAALAAKVQESVSDPAESQQALEAAERSKAALRRRLAEFQRRVAELEEELPARTQAAKTADTGRDGAPARTGVGRFRFGAVQQRKEAALIEELTIRLQAECCERRAATVKLMMQGWALLERLRALKLSKAQVEAQLRSASGASRQAEATEPQAWAREKRREDAESAQPSPVEDGGFLFFGRAVGVGRESAAATPKARTRKRESEEEIRTREMLL